MPTLFYIKYFDGAHEDCPNRLEFFYYPVQAVMRRDEILRQISDAGGKDKCDIFYDGKYEQFKYRTVFDLIGCLNEINKIFST
jgi:hypothetical protein